MVPRGVTVRQAGEPRPYIPSTNLLMKAARQAKRKAAIKIICKALGVSNRLALIHLRDENAWSRIDTSARLREIAYWIEAECVENMQLVEVNLITNPGRND